MKHTYFLVLLTFVRVNTIPVITLAPSPISAPLDTLVNFTCVGTGDALYWTVEGHSLTDTIKQYREILVTTNNISVDVWSSVLTIRALPINNEIDVGCTLVFQSFYFVSKGATLKAEDITPVKNLQFLFNVITSWVTWSHPFQNYPLSYHIYIENQHGQLLYNDITNDTSYELYNLTVCDIYTATVIAHSGEYSSNNVTIQREYNGEHYTVIILPNHEVIFNKHNNSFDIQFQLNIISYPRICNSTILGITREISLLSEAEIEHNRRNIRSPLSYYNASNIGPYLNCVFIAKILDYFNNFKTKNESYFTTHHVQGLALRNYSDNGSVLVECEFAERSTADGCHVIFRESSKGTVNSTNITKSSIEESTVYQYISLPVSGNYTVTAHDIVDGTIITNPSVVYPQVLEYILILPSPTETSATVNVPSTLVSTRPTSRTSDSLGTLYLYSILILSSVIAIIIIVLTVIVSSCLVVKKKQLMTHNPTCDEVHRLEMRSRRVELETM